MSALSNGFTSQTIDSFIEKNKKKGPEASSKIKDKPIKQNLSTSLIVASCDNKKSKAHQSTTKEIEILDLDSSKPSASLHQRIKIKKTNLPKL